MTTAKLRLSELYTSIQGEGPRAGQPTQFVRFAGCNLKCPGWPCDTPHAIDPRIFEREQHILSPEELCEQLALWPRRLCLTGGEPFIQNHAALEKFCRQAWLLGYHIECFSNGTILYPDWALRQLPFIMDWKLTGSGEDPQNENRFKNLEGLGSGDAVKFVIKDREDYEEALYLYHNTPALHGLVRPVVYFGAVFSALPERQLVEWMLEDKLGYVKLNVQVHNYIWPANERGR